MTDLAPWLGKIDRVREIVRDAGEVVRSAAHSAKRPSVAFKAGPADPVSECDVEVERLIRARLAEVLPGDRFWGEESGIPTDPHLGPVWICDPIDGTLSFLRFSRNYCISLGLLLDGRAAIAMIFDPENGEFYEAIRGRGASLNGRALAQPGLPDMRHAMVGFGYSARVEAARHTELIRRILEAGALTHQHGSGALALAHVAAGKLDAYVELHMNAWDALPGLLIAREAGASCLDWAPETLTKGSTVLAANPTIAGQLLAWIDEVKSEETKA